MLFSAALVLAVAAAAVPTGDRCAAPAPVPTPGYAGNSLAADTTSTIDTTSYPANTPTVAFGAATIKGKFSADKTAASFLNIPYAAAPVGNLRFRPPQPAPDFKGTYDATKMGNSCMQGPAPQFYGGVNQNNSEDCLNLNIFVPAEALKAGAKLPVTVYIYGGGFNDGYNNMPIYDGAAVIKAQPKGQKSIVVVPNYRTNIFGFATSNELLAEGDVNVGILDQKAVFEWVRSNIAKFGGNPNKVTAWGESAGAITIATHMVSGDVTKPLFDAAIIESGGLFAFGNIPAITQGGFNALATKLNCSAPVLDCMRKVPAEDLRQAAADAGVSYLPAVDGKYVKQQPLVAISQGQIYKIPTILLENTNEGTYFTTSIKTADDVTNLFKGFGFFNADAVAQLQKLYPVSSFASPFLAGAEFYGDLVFKCPERLLAKTLTAAGAKVYKGRFNVKPTINLAAGADFFGAIGIYHTAEQAFVWNYSPLLNTTNYEKSLSQKMINTWSDIIAGKTPGSSAGISWPTFGSTGKQFVWNPTSTAVETLSATYTARCDFLDAASLAFSKSLNG
ncbi:hypothetical protein HK105_203182 [Polyrhizophydium stewartii]|uniref:Carboxylesterase type B domain-containing protein n=1 Tax=Polyrhizophydium stewartii TaxID=2732419 RepID=A0ABR4NC91_9FUNG